MAFVRRLAVFLRLAVFDANRGGLSCAFILGLCAVFTATASVYAETFELFGVIEEGFESVNHDDERCSCDLLKSPKCTPTTWECYGSFVKGVIFEYDHVLSCERSVMPDGTTECVKVTEKRAVQCGVFGSKKECEEAGVVKEVKLPLECDDKCRIADQPRWIPCEVAKKIPGKEGFEDVFSECEQCSDRRSCGKSYCFGVRLDPDTGCEPSLDPTIAGCTWGKDPPSSDNQAVLATD